MNWFSTPLTRLLSASNFYLVIFFSESRFSSLESPEKGQVFVLRLFHGYKKAGLPAKRFNKHSPFSTKRKRYTRSRNIHISQVLLCPLTGKSIEFKAGSRRARSQPRRCLTFKSWGFWLVLKKKCQVIIDCNFCLSKMNTWNLYYPPDIQEGWSDSFWITGVLFSPAFPGHIRESFLFFSPCFFYKFSGLSCQGQSLITKGLDQSTRSEERNTEPNFSEGRN